uniref:Uncharacterized protein n=1 Tax=Lotus japonicus TaxID=34305 RepID=I3SYT0_LOTJA|nr:unknown [Lotus japonicus]
MFSSSSLSFFFFGPNQQQFSTDLLHLYHSCTYQMKWQMK